MGIRERWKGIKPLPKGIKEKVSELTPLFEREGILLAYLFGSLAQAGKGDDVDLAILPGGRFDFIEFYSRLSRFLNTDRIDLVRLDKASPSFKFEIISRGALIYKSSDEVENCFEHSAIAHYREEQIRQRNWLEILKRRLKNELG